ncbi:30S ribosomal protein S14 [Microscilla marina]|uniref:Small ribosomal subunit protein uS14 n=1 Tax=Microscilla marina ATCC 23134 TaxID=313606 RepID=A1ZGS8_MICM2|nr:30S ribosomal protein S14 [Microscilla marina]EAY30197.1 30S ribosomal protein S14 [Microscilla marina ATCC 23134]
MARESIKARERKRERMVAKYAQKREDLRLKIKEAIKAGEDPTEYYVALDKLPKNASPIRLHNRCKVTGRPKGYMRKFGICRNVFREMASEGKIPGITKSSW